MFRLLQLAMRRFRSPEDYRAMQSFIAEASIAEMQARGIDLARSRVLELGAGYGGYSLILHQRSKSFIASDFRKTRLFDELDIPFEQVNVQQSFPFETSDFDLVYCSSLIEHVAEPKTMLRESWRILRAGGVLFLSFPPFYSLTLVGGHNFKPFHLLGERLSIRIYNFFHRTHIQNYASCYTTWGLFPLKIDEVKELIQESGFEIIDVYARMSAINTARLPGILKDLTTWHVCYLAQKP